MYIQIIKEIKNTITYTIFRIIFNLLKFINKIKHSNIAGNINIIGFIVLP